MVSSTLLALFLIAAPAHAKKPAITAESMEVGQAWGQAVAMKVVAKMQAQ